MLAKFLVFSCFQWASYHNRGLASCGKLGGILPKYLQLHSMTRGLRFPPFKSGPHLMLHDPPFSLSILHNYDPLKQDRLMRWMWGILEFDQLYKQTENKMQVAGKTSSSK